MQKKTSGLAKTVEVVKNSVEQFLSDKEIKPDNSGNILRADEEEKVVPVVLKTRERTPYNSDVINTFSGDGYNPIFEKRNTTGWTSGKNFSKWRFRTQLLHEFTRSDDPEEFIRRNG